MSDDNTFDDDISFFDDKVKESLLNESFLVEKKTFDILCQLYENTYIEKDVCQYGNCEYTAGAHGLCKLHLCIHMSVTPT